MTTLKDTKLGDRVRIWLNTSFGISENETNFAIEATVIGTGTEGDGAHDETERMLGWTIDQMHPSSDQMTVAEPDYCDDVKWVSNRANFAYWRNVQMRTKCEILPSLPATKPAQTTPPPQPELVKTKWVNGTFKDVQLGDRVRVYVYKNGNIASNCGGGRDTIEATVIGLNAEDPFDCPVVLGWKANEVPGQDALEMGRFTNLEMDWKHTLYNGFTDYPYHWGGDYDVNCQILRTTTSIPAPPQPVQSAPPKAEWKDATFKDVKLGDKVKVYLTKTERFSGKPTDLAIEATVIGMNSKEKWAHLPGDVLLGWKKGEGRPLDADKPGAGPRCFKDYVTNDRKDYPWRFAVEFDEHCQILTKVPSETKPELPQQGQQPVKIYGSFTNKTAWLAFLSCLFNNCSSIDYRASWLVHYLDRKAISTEHFDTLVFEGMDPAVITYWEEHHKDKPSSPISAVIDQVAAKEEPKDTNSASSMAMLAGGALLGGLAAALGKSMAGASGVRVAEGSGLSEAVVEAAEAAAVAS